MTWPLMSQLAIHNAENNAHPGIVHAKFMAADEDVWFYCVVFAICCHRPCVACSESYVYAHTKHNRLCSCLFLFSPSRQFTAKRLLHQMESAYAQFRKYNSYNSAQRLPPFTNYSSFMVAGRTGNGARALHFCAFARV